MKLKKSKDEDSVPLQNQNTRHNDNNNSDVKGKGEADVAQIPRATVSRESDSGVGGKVALRATAPAVGKGSFFGTRPGLDLRNSAPEHSNYAAATGGSMANVNAVAAAATSKAAKLTDEQIRYVVGGEEVLIIGGTAGIGLALAKALTDFDASVTVVGRRKVDAPKIKSVQADLSSVKSQRALADLIPNVSELSLVVFTVGMYPGPERQDNGEGVELSLSVSCLSRRVILQRLLERGLSKKNCRVFVMGGCGDHYSKMDLDDFNASRDYRFAAQKANAIVGNDALVLGFRKRHPELKIWGVNPGFVDTEIRVNSYKVKALGKVIEKVAGTHALSPEFYVKSVRTKKKKKKKEKEFAPC